MKRQRSTEPLSCQGCPLVSFPWGIVGVFGPMAGFTVQAMGPLRAVHPALPHVVTLAARGLQELTIGDEQIHGLFDETSAATLAQRG